MDRRQKKTRKSIFEAFTGLLSEKDYHHITVADIIERADVGRATFYSHFETKDFLLKELCEELFCHIFDAAENKGLDHSHIFSCDPPNSVFLHLFMHFYKNDNNILRLLSSRNNELFFGYFKIYLKKLVESQLPVLRQNISDKLPESFIINHVVSVFIATLRWWVDNDLKVSPETITQYFYLAV